MENPKILKIPKKFSTESSFFKQNHGFFVENYVETVESGMFSRLGEGGLFFRGHVASKGSRKGPAGARFFVLLETKGSIFRGKFEEGISPPSWRHNGSIAACRHHRQGEGRCACVYGASGICYNKSL